MRLKLHGVAILACLAMMTPGCVVHHYDSGGHGTSQASRSGPGGPPPHAPAHGHRRKHGVHSGSELAIEFDSGLGVYVVLGHRDHYWDGEHYLRWTGESWEASVDFEGRWAVVASSSDVPLGFARSMRALTARSASTIRPSTVTSAP